MSITDELRKCVISNKDFWGMNRYVDILLAIADRIDEWNKADVRCEYTRGYTAGFDAASDEVESVDELRERMEREYIKLPVDADGVPIRVGDELEGLHYENGIVTGIQFAADGRAMVAIRPNGWDTSTWRDPEEYSHRKPDSWEQIIEDAISESGWGQPKEYEADFEDSKETRDRFVAELVERCRRLAGE